MSNLPGNPHVVDPDGAATLDACLTASATLALAYEQRTANLIAYVEKIDDQTLIAERCSEIAHRLGLKTSREMRAEK
ncbi:hypothetical protein SLW73_02495 [Glutamicibacter protophormiae]|uniref:hypothetical protein n=1 Tax=Glutamicibacter protophormiae TaxID=37930 RepID=UPI002A81A242|nr:hypothetical protein [Glutamicibacter protophormiae]WPR65229.1 hypothetical protein SLW72_02495 [Glutamicibacter protophormiae]WPR68726.1 hypothetical protein SLW73_02495 [Glutamicibacter protophormiae]